MRRFDIQLVDTVSERWILTTCEGDLNDDESEDEKFMREMDEKGLQTFEEYQQ